MGDNSKRIEAIREAIRVIKAMEDKSTVYQNRMNVLFAELDEEEDTRAIEYWEDIFDGIVESLSEAESFRQELLESMEGYIEELSPPKEDPHLAKPHNPHPLLKRSGKKF